MEGEGSRTTDEAIPADEKRARLGAMAPMSTDPTKALSNGNSIKGWMGNFNSNLSFQSHSRELVHNTMVKHRDYVSWMQNMVATCRYYEAPVWHTINWIGMR